MAAEQSKTVTHGMGEIPDIIFFFSKKNVTASYSIMFVGWGNSYLNYAGSNYTGFALYRGNSSTNLSGVRVTPDYGINSVTATTFNIKTYSSSANYYWRVGTYDFIAIKYS